MGRMSIATVSSPEFINITSMSPFASKCEIKVFYLGENRNRSCITKEVAVQMAQTLPGCPIVGYFSENQDDFRDHGEQVVMDGDGIKFKCLTVPYGFVAPDAKVWFKDFEDTDEFGNAVIRTYLMTEGYLWTEQYKEAQKIINEGRPQSMELDESTLKGHWSTNNNKGIDFFIINDAIFSKLCILGEDVEPCFEGAEVTSPDVSVAFSMDDNFKNTLFSMMKELKTLTYSLKEEINKGGESMPEEVNTVAEETQATEFAANENAEASVTEAGNTSNENFSANEDKSEQEITNENQTSIEETEFSKKEDEKEEETDSKEEEKDTDSKEDDSTEEEDKEKKTNHTLEEKFELLTQEYNDLKEKFSAIEAENKELNEFKKTAENKEKDALIESFYMLSDEDKKDVIENKSTYTLDEIKSKLAIVCFDKKVDFNLNKENEETDTDIPLTYNLDGEVDTLPAWLQAVEDHKSKE